MGCCSTHLVTKVTHFETHIHETHEGENGPPLTDREFTARTARTINTVTTARESRVFVDIEEENEEGESTTKKRKRKRRETFVDRLYYNWEPKNIDHPNRYPFTLDTYPFAQVTELTEASELSSDEKRPWKGKHVDKTPDFVSRLYPEPPQRVVEEEPTPEVTRKAKPLTDQEIHRNLEQAIYKSNRPDAFFNMLTNAPFRKVCYAELEWPSKPVSIRHCYGSVWVAQDDAITAYDLDLQPVNFIDLDRKERRIHHSLLHQIQTVVAVSTAQMVVVCGTGLHLMNKAGQYSGRITEGPYTDASSYDGRLYASTFGVFKTAQINVFDERKAWDLLYTVKVPVDGITTLCVTEKHMAVCSRDSCNIFLTDPTGSTLRKVGSKGQIGKFGHFVKPRICQGSYDGSCIIVDEATNELCALSQSGRVQQIYLMHRVKRPGGAAVARGALYVLQLKRPYTVFKFM